MTEIIRLKHLEYLKRAAECHHKADKTTSSAARSFFLDAEINWLSVAASCELQARKQLGPADGDEGHNPFARP